MFNIVEYLQDRDIDYDKEGENVTRGWTNINCIFPNCGDPKNHLGINPEGTGFSCWMCGAKGKIWELVSIIDQCSNKEANRIISKYYDGVKRDRYIPIKKSPELIIPEGLTKEFTKIAIDYLKEKRGLDPEHIIEKYNVYWGGVHGYFKYRLVFPITINREIVTYVGRDVTGKAHLNYRNWLNRFSSRTVKNSVFNIDSITKNKAIIVEGIFDALKIGDGCIALMGKTFTQEQIELILSKKLKSVFILLDSKEKDPDIEIVINKLKRALLGHIKNIEILELDKGDPGDFTEQEVFNVRKEYLL